MIGLLSVIIQKNCLVMSPFSVDTSTGFLQGFQLNHDLLKISSVLVFSDKAEPKKRKANRIVDSDDEEGVVVIAEETLTVC
jgi:hypothetical protein